MRVVHAVLSIFFLTLAMFTAVADTETGKTEKDFIGADFVMHAIGRLKDNYVFPHELGLTKLLNIGLDELERTAGKGLALRRIRGVYGKSDAEAEQIFREEFEKTKKFARSKGGFSRADFALNALKAILASLGRSHTGIAMTDFEDHLRFAGRGEGYGGLGIVVAERDKCFFVDHVFSDSPASRAGLRRFDELVEIDGVTVRGNTLERLRGEEGSKVSLILKRGEELGWVEVIRGRVVTNKVEWMRIGKTEERLNMLYFNEFHPEVILPITSYISYHRLRGIIFDLRGNVGGHTRSDDNGSEPPALEPLLELFLPHQTILYLKKTDANMRFCYSEPPFGISKPFNLPIVVLLNRDSMSAAEVFARVLQYYGKATIVGEKSAGRGGEFSKNVLLPFGYVMSVTTSLLILPDGKLLEGRGVTPDFEVALSAADMRAGRDPQLDKAVEVLRWLVSR